MGSHFPQKRENDPSKSTRAARFRVAGEQDASVFSAYLGATLWVGLAADPQQNAEAHIFTDKAACVPSSSP
jgi:hypothetical protein